MDKIHTAAIYCRLSEEDKNKAGAESESIQNQKAMLEQYAREQGWSIWEIYCDEDYTGSDRNRPAFNRLLLDARAGCFDIILCKSQSRFTRELELVEKYLHGKFPEWGIRFIGYADHADTENRGNKKSRQINGLVNEWYLEDLSENIKTVFRTKQQNGKFIGSFAPYGYEKSAQDKNLLVPDVDAADIVKKIFVYSADGMSASEIAAKLNAAHIPNPSAYKQRRYPTFRRAGIPTEQWCGTSVRELLSNPVYYGALRQHLREKRSYKSDAVSRVDEDEWIIVDGTHQPIVSKELWQQAQQKNKARRHTAKDNLQQRCFCGVCRRLLKVRYSHGNKYYACKEHKVLIRVDELRSLVHADDDFEVKSRTALQKSGPKITALQRQLKHLYEDHAAGNLPDEVFRTLQREWQRDYERQKKQEKNTDEETGIQYMIYPRQNRSSPPKIEVITRKEEAFF